MTLPPTVALKGLRLKVLQQTLRLGGSGLRSSAGLGMRWTGHERVRPAPGRPTWSGRNGQLRYLSAGRGENGKGEKGSTPLSKRLPSILPIHENVYTLPNILTFSRLLSAPVIGYLILHGMHLPALSLFVYAGVTDLVDGWIARKWKLQTVVGTVVDPLADKALMTVVVGCLAWEKALPVPLALLILGRDVLLGLSAIYYRYISLPPPKTLVRYWDFSLPSAEVRPTRISKVNTALQLGLMGWTMASMVWDMGMLGEEGLRGMQYIVAATTTWSGASYIYTKDAVTILKAGERLGRSGRK